MADVVPLQGLHDVRGFTCDYCGELCDPEAHELNALDCTFPNCPKECSVYHQDCLEKYLKSIRLEKNRKTGFKCPRGCGKSSKHEPCPGKIDKSHPIHMRNDAAKKKKKLPIILPEKPKPSPKDKAAPSTASAKEKDKKLKETTRVTPTKPSALDKAGQAKKGVAASPASAQVVVALAAARAELKGKAGAVQPPVRTAPTKPQPAVQTLEEFEAARASHLNRGGIRTDAPSLNAWAAAPLSKGPSASHLDLSSTVAFPAPQPTRSSISTGGQPATDGAPGTLLLAAWMPGNISLGGTSSANSTSGGAGSGRGADSATSTTATSRKEEGEEESSLTRAQRKSLRRAERKNQARSVKDPAPGVPPPAPDPLPDAAAEEPPGDRGDPAGEDGEWGGAPSLVPAPLPPDDEVSMTLASLEESVVGALQMARSRFLLAQLQDLGFPEWQCRAAVALFGSDLVAAFMYLLEDPVATPDKANAVIAAIRSPPLLDVQHQGHILAEIQREHGIEWETLARAVIEYEGDIEAAVATIFHRAEENGTFNSRSFSEANGQYRTGAPPYGHMGGSNPFPQEQPQQHAHTQVQYQQQAAVQQYHQQHAQQQYYAMANGHVYPQPHGGHMDSQMAATMGGGAYGMPMEASHIWGHARNGVPGPPESHSFAGFGRPDSSASLANAESASTWSADSAVAYSAQQHQVMSHGGAHPAGLHSHPLQSKDSSSQGSITPVSRQNSGNLSFSWPTQPAASSTFFGLQSSTTSIVDSLPSQADVDALFAFPHHIESASLSSFHHHSMGAQKDAESSVPLFARGAGGSFSSQQPLFARVAETAPADSRSREAGGGFGNRGGLQPEPWSVAVQRQGHFPDHTTGTMESHDLESFVSQVLDGSQP